MSNQPGGQRPVGSVVGGRYRLGRLLGEGGMGAVYEAALTDRPDQRVAVKMLHAEMAENSTVVERFVAEGNVCRTLDHPGILRVFDSGTDLNTPYLVMELLEGRALIDYTEHGQRLPVNFAVTVLSGMLEALGYAHDRGIVHRDLKPENVFLVPTPDGGWRAKILDFGIAKCIDAAGGAKRRTATGVLLGTPGYMSPEQVKGSKSLDHRTDLWACGVMFYEMVAGASPFRGEGEDPNNIWGLISAVLTREPAPLASFDPHLAPFDTFLASCLAKEPDRRYATAWQMREDLLRIARGEVRISDPSSPQASPFTREQRVPINSRGELQAIPAVQAGQAQPHAYGAPGTLGTGRPSAELPPAGGIGSTVPTGAAGGVSANRQAFEQLGGTVPMTPGGAAALMASAGPARPNQAYNAQSQLAATALAPNPPPMSTPQPRFGTSPSGFGPPPDPRGAAPAPIIPAQSSSVVDGQDSGGSMLPWILLGIALVAALGGAVVWIMH